MKKTKAPAIAPVELDEATQRKAETLCKLAGISQDELYDRLLRAEHARLFQGKGKKGMALREWLDAMPPEAEGDHRYPHHTTQVSITMGTEEWLAVKTCADIHNMTLDEVLSRLLTSEHDLISDLFNRQFMFRSEVEKAD